MQNGLVSEGRWLANAPGGIQWVESSEKKTEGVYATFTLKDGPDAGARVDWSGWISDNNAARIAASLEAMGYDGTSDSSAARNDVIVTVKHETNPKDQKTYARVAFVDDPNRARFEPLTGAKLEGVKARLRAAKLASANAQAPRADDPKF